MTPEVIARILVHYQPWDRPEGAVTPLGGAGGLSGSRLWRFRARAGERVLRAWPEGATSRARIEAVHGWLATAADLPFVPQPIADQSGSKVVEADGRFWELTPWLPGTPDLAPRPDPDRVRAAFSGLAQLHLRFARAGEARERSPGLVGRRSELARLLHGGLASIERELDANLGDALAAKSRDWVVLVWRVAPRVFTATEELANARLPLQPCVRDARAEHFLFEGSRLTGLLDFGAAGLECVSADLARLMGEWLPRGLADDLREIGLSAYQEIRPLTDEEMPVIEAFESLADLLIAERWIRWRFLERRRFDREAAFAEGVERGLVRLHRLASRLGV